jgi:hypothetical protein
MVTRNAPAVVTGKAGLKLEIELRPSLTLMLTHSPLDI